MSIFDQFEQNLPGDSHVRKVQLDKDEYELFPAEEEIFDRDQRSFWWFYLVIVFVFLILSSQLLNLQITHGNFNRFLAEGNRIRTRFIPAPRGIVFDNTGKALVQNDASFALQLYPIDLPRAADEKQKFYENLSTVTQIPVSEIKDKVNQKGLTSSSAVILKENIDRDTALLLETKIIDLPGVVMAVEPIRHYSDIPGLSFVLGYTGKVTDQDIKNNRDATLGLNQEIGKDGLEKVYQDYLKGQDGITEIEVDSRGRSQRMLTS